MNKSFTLLLQYEVKITFNTFYENFIKFLDTNDCKYFVMVPGHSYFVCRKSKLWNKSNNLINNYDIEIKFEKKNKILLVSFVIINIKDVNSSKNEFIKLTQSLIIDLCK